MILSANGSSVEITTPEYGYSSIVHMPINWVETANGWDGWDNGKGQTTYDYRTCKIPRFLFSKAMQADIVDFLLDSTKGRNTDITIELGESETGFFPFGPDKGDLGDFECRIINRMPTGILDNPWLYFGNEVEMVMVSAPQYAIPVPVDQGDLQIGTVDGLMYPQDGIKPISKYGLRQDLTLSGAVNALDIAHNQYETEFELWANHSKAAALIDHLTGTVRNNDVSIVAPDNHFLYGAENGASGNYTSKLIQSSIEIRHIEYDQFRIPLKFWMKAVA